MTKFMFTIQFWWEYMAGDWPEQKHHIIIPLNKRYGMNSYLFSTTNDSYIYDFWSKKKWVKLNCRLPDWQKR
jgi:hypothetical protein